MNALRVKALVLLLLMVAAFAGAAAWKPTIHMADTRPKVDLETMFPKQFREWVVDDRMPVQLISPDQAATLNRIYNQTLSRTYVNRQGERVMLSVAYGGDQSDGTRAHRPEVCYPAQGFQILSNRTAEYRLDDRAVSARELVAKLGGRVEPITYWVVVGGAVATTSTQQKLAQLRFGMRGMIPDGALFRVSSINSDMGEAYALHARFISDLSQSMRQTDRRFVFGSTGQ